MPRLPARSVAPQLAARPRPTSAVPWVIGWGVYAVLVLVGFGFGVWAANQKPKPAETARAEPPPAAPTPVAPAPTTPSPVPPPKKEPPVAVTPEPKKSPDPKPPAVTPAPEPKKTPAPEPKKAPAPEPKKSPEPPVAQVSFAKEVLPVFKSKCNICHGDSKGVKGGLDLRTVAGVTKGGDGGPGVKPGDLKNSSIWTAIDDGSMPPAGKDQLTDAEKAVIRKWILAGAK